MHTGYCMVGNVLHNGRCIIGPLGAVITAGIIVARIADTALELAGKEYGHLAESQ